MGEADGGISNAMTSSEYDESYRRVNAYIAALGVHQEFLRNQLVHRVMERTFDETKPGERASLEIAIREVEQETFSWLSRVLAISQDQTEEISLRGRLALLLADFPGKWQELFLADPPWPEDFVRAMRESYLNAVPHFYTGSMVDRPLELGYIPRLAEVTLLTLEKTRWLRLILLWGGFIGFFALLFYYSR